MLEKNFLREGEGFFKVLSCLQSVSVFSTSILRSQEKLIGTIHLLWFVPFRWIADLTGFHRQMCSRGGGLLFREVIMFDGQAEDVLESEMALLNVHRYVRGDDDVVIAERAHFAATIPREADSGDPHLTCLLAGLEDVSGVS